jgi:hypothetical protein
MRWLTLFVITLYFKQTGLEGVSWVHVVSVLAQWRVLRTQ